MVPADGIRAVDNRRVSSRTNNPVPARAVEPETAAATAGGEWSSHSGPVVTVDSRLRSAVVQDCAGGSDGRIRRTVRPRVNRTSQPVRTHTEDTRHFRNTFRHVRGFDGVGRLSFWMVMDRRKEAVRVQISLRKFAHRCAAFLSRPFLLRDLSHASKPSFS